MTGPAQAANSAGAGRGKSVALPGGHAVGATPRRVLSNGCTGNKKVQLAGTSEQTTFFYTIDEFQAQAICLGTFEGHESAFTGDGHRFRVRAYEGLIAGGWSRVYNNTFGATQVTGGLAAKFAIHSSFGVSHANDEFMVCTTWVTTGGVQELTPLCTKVLTS
jgi:hypothetical protein